MTYDNDDDNDDDDDDDGNDNDKRWRVYVTHVHIKVFKKDIRMYYLCAEIRSVKLHTQLTQSIPPLGVCLKILEHHEEVITVYQTRQFLTHHYDITTTKRKQ